MKPTKPKGLLIAAVCSAIACILQIILLFRYLGRLTDDWVGIGLCSAAIAAFAIGAIGFYIQWRKQKQEE